MGLQQNHKKSSKNSNKLTKGGGGNNSSAMQSMRDSIDYQSLKSGPANSKKQKKKSAKPVL